ncbi:hypothetical protein B4113_2091 [Geobacillus sp. B4113_201601]|nr:hypothetical protein B4113_2091 [Geobacillus sp. B4113_201601]
MRTMPPWLRSFPFSYCFPASALYARHFLQKKPQTRLRHTRLGPGELSDQPFV